MVTIILNKPQMGENIGAAARSMLNFGLEDLRLVKPRDGWPSQRANANASGALEIMPQVRIFDTLREATADLHFTFATTVRTRDMVKPSYMSEAAILEGNRRVKQGQNVGIVFGAEQSGLSNEDISLCQAIISVPTNPDFSSLNLGQAVLLMSYEWMRSQNDSISSPCPKVDMGENLPAKQCDIQKFVQRLEDDLEDRKFFRTKDLKPTMINNIRNIFTRADINDKELRMLHGILSALRGNKTDNKSPK